MNASASASDSAKKKQLLIIDDETNMRHMLSAMLSGYGYVVETAGDGVEGLEKIQTQTFDFVLCDIKMPKMGGMDFLRTAGSRLKDTTVIMMSAYGTIDTALEAMKLGAYDYISKPFKSDEVRMALKKAEERETLRRENLNLKEQIRNMGARGRFGDLIASSKPMQETIELARKAARYDTTVLITGESGTGKELVAMGIHSGSPRAAMPMVTVNCGGIPENLLESEFFGHKKGAFTGAERDHKGLFEAAHRGTLFLDEIGELPPNLQVKLLRVLQDSEIRAVGDAKTRRVDVRVIAATAKDLENGVLEGEFREDLFYRLNVFPIRLPPLRERPEDIPALAEHFLSRYNQQLDTAIRAIAPAAMSILWQYGWPGNVRELENVIERALVIAEGETLLPSHLPAQLIRPPDHSPGPAEHDGYSIKKARIQWEKALIAKALKKTGGNRTHAAKLLEISHPSLLSKIKQYGLR